MTLTLPQKVKSLTQSILDTMESGTVFTTGDLSTRVHDNYLSDDRDETVWSTPDQSRVRHNVRSYQQTLKNRGVIRQVNHGQWVIV